MISEARNGSGLTPLVAPKPQKPTLEEKAEAEVCGEPLTLKEPEPHSPSQDDIFSELAKITSKLGKTRVSSRKR
jgi:hypothetical protein